jgi:CMP/dCMP kinase
LEKKLTIAIDGFSACGKSTLAKDLAKILGYVFVDSGAMYRAVSLFALRNNIIVKEEIDLIELHKLLPKIDLKLEKCDGDDIVLLNGEDVSSEIRENHVAKIVSKIAAVKEVRQMLVQLQQKMGEKGGIIMDGRDIGSVVFPNAELKIFVTANKEVRVLRRYNELLSKGITTTLEDVKKNLEERDYMDTNREESPLIKVSDARVLDNSNLTKLEQLQLVINWVNEIGLISFEN